MSASNAGPGGVRNLRAMFEHKANDPSNSPPSRGRSPHESGSLSQDRPLSKVRASFVPVGKVGEKEQCEASVQQPLNLTMDGASEKSVLDEQGLGEILKGSPFVSDGETEGESGARSDCNGAADRAGAMVKRMQQDNPDPPLSGEFIDPSAGPRIKPIGPGRKPVKPRLETTASPESTSKSPVEPKGPIVKPRGGVAKIQGVMDSAKRAQEANATFANSVQAKDESVKVPNTSGAVNGTNTERNTSAQNPKPKGTTLRSQRTLEPASKSTSVQSSERADASTKTKTLKSPTVSKPARTSLPTRKLPSTTTPATSLIPKSDDSNPMETRTTEKVTTKVPPRIANATTASSLAKKTSRASLNSNETTKSKPTTRLPADEGFLARMMRPTASSAQKAHEKAQVPSHAYAKHPPGKALTTKPSRKSLTTAGENKENETSLPPLPAMSRDSQGNTTSSEPQLAEVNTLT